MSIDQNFLTLAANAMASGRAAEAMLFQRCREVVHSQSSAADIGVYIEKALQAGVSPVMQVNNELVSLAREAIIAGNADVAWHIAQWTSANRGNLRLQNFMLPNIHLGLTPNALVYMTATLQKPEHLKRLLDLGGLPNEPVDGMPFLHWLLTINGVDAGKRFAMVEAVLNKGADPSELVENGPERLNGLNAIEVFKIAAGDSLEENAQLQKILDVLNMHMAAAKHDKDEADMPVTIN